MSEPQVTSRLIHGDCLEVMPTLERSSVNLVITDLPYGISGCAWDTPISLPSMWQSLGILGAKNCVFIFTSAQPFTSFLLMSNPQAFKQELIWHKNRPTGFYQAKSGPLRAHESMLIFAQGKIAYMPQMVPGKKFCVTSRAGAANHYGGRSLDRSKSTHDGAMRHPRSVLQFDESDLRRDGLNGNTTRIMHPTQKPLAMYSWLLRSYSKEGDNILDLCAGSGTTAIAALRTGRHSICIEKDPTYFAVMQKRVADERAKLGMVPM